MENQENRLQLLYKECIKELESVGIRISEKSKIGEIDIKISKRNNKRYACCRQEDPIKEEKNIKKTKGKISISYNKFRKHHIEVSKWVMDLDEHIIKETIMHEVIHCFPYCNNHGANFKRYANFINQTLGYNIKTLGNKKEDYIKSNLEYKTENENYKYKIICKQCGNVLYRKRLKRNFVKKYCCGKCKGKLEVFEMNNERNNKNESI